MNKKTIVTILIAVFGVLAFGTAWSRFSRDGNAMAQKADHDERGHDDPGQDDHDDDRDDHGDQGAHDDPGAESIVRLSPEERSKFEVVVATAGSGQLATEIRLPGEIVLNADRVAHIVPRAPGVVIEVLASVGDTVRTGEVMAWLESAELGEAKVEYLSKWAALGSSSVDLVRAREVQRTCER